MNISSVASTSSYSPFSSPYSRQNSPRSHNNVTVPIVDRDVLAQRTLLGDDVYISSELDCASPLATPSPMIKQLSPLTVASHLQDNMLVNPFLDDYEHATITTGHGPSYSAAAAAPQLNKQHKRDNVRNQSTQRSTLRSSSAMTSHGSATGLGLDITINQHDRHTRQAPRMGHLDQPATATLRSTPAIQSTTTTSRRRTTKTPAILNSYDLPPTEMSYSSSSSSSSPSSPTPTWRRPSVFPLGPVPPPLPPRRARYEPPPHIVDVAVERFNINKRTLGSSSSPTDDTVSTPAPSSALEQERQRQWQQWEAERVRSLEMTREAAKNNRVQAPSSSSSNRTTTTTTTAVSEKPSIPSSSTSTTKKSKSKWWSCFGGSNAHDANNEEVINEKKSRLEAIDVEDNEEEDEEEWDEARAASGTGLLSSFTFSCSKNTKPRATLKKKTF